MTQPLNSFFNAQIGNPPITFLVLRYPTDLHYPVTASHQSAVI